jgi:hypothetical protein
MVGQNTYSDRIHCLAEYTFKPKTESSRIHSQVKLIIKQNAQKSRT